MTGSKQWIEAPTAAVLPPSAAFAGGPNGLTAQDFWQWGFSDLRLNIVRGVFAEFLVAKAVGDPATALRDPWADYDVLTPDGVKIEVKSSAYLQAWGQERITRPSFSGLTGRSWSPLTGKSKEREIRADVFVFCLQISQRHEDYNPLDVEQWVFWALNAEVIRQRGFRQAALSFVNEHGWMCEWTQLEEAVKEAKRE